MTACIQLVCDATPGQRGRPVAQPHVGSRPVSCPERAREWTQAARLDQGRCNRYCRSAPYPARIFYFCRTYVESTISSPQLLIGAKKDSAGTWRWKDEHGHDVRNVSSRCPLGQPKAVKTLLGLVAQFVPDLGSHGPVKSRWRSQVRRERNRLPSGYQEFEFSGSDCAIWTTMRFQPA